MVERRGRGGIVTSHGGKTVKAQAQTQTNGPLLVHYRLNLFPHVGVPLTPSSSISHRYPESPYMFPLCLTSRQLPNIGTSDICCIVSNGGSGVDHCGVACLALLVSFFHIRMRLALTEFHSLPHNLLWVTSSIFAHLVSVSPGHSFYAVSLIFMPVQMPWTNSVQS
jgi:hypothetical protein